MGLRYSEEKVDSITKGISAMLFGIRGIEESSVYQGIFKRGEAQGIAEGRIDEAREVLLRQGRKKLGPPGEKVEAEITALADLDRLHDLIDRILDVSTWDELLALPSPNSSTPPSQGVP